MEKLEDRKKIVNMAILRKTRITIIGFGDVVRISSEVEGVKNIGYVSEEYTDYMFLVVDSVLGIDIGSLHFEFVVRENFAFFFENNDGKIIVEVE
ncbi:MAG: hypothetical protein QXF15_03800 [Candidatus Aenigmatarchaeota archaeon]